MVTSTVNNKVRVGALLKVVVGGDAARGTVPPNPDLVRLASSFRIFAKKLQYLIKRAKAQYDAMLTIARTTELVAQDIASLSESSPLYELVGLSQLRKKAAIKDSNDHDDDDDDDDDDDYDDNDYDDEKKVPDKQGRIQARSTTTWALRKNDADMDTSSIDGPQITDSITCTSSYFSIHQAWASKARRNRTMYGKLVLDYVIQWERVVTNRVSADLKRVERLRVELVHYQTKVETLKVNVATMQKKCQKVNNNNNNNNNNNTILDELVEKLKRNQEKCNETRKRYQKLVADTCLLLDEIVNRSWRDLQPLVLEMARLDIQFSSEQATTLGALKHVMVQIKRQAATIEDDSDDSSSRGQRGSSFFQRLWKDLKTKTPENRLTMTPSNDDETTHGPLLQHLFDDYDQELVDALCCVIMGKGEEKEEEHEEQEGNSVIEVVSERDEEDDDEEEEEEENDKHPTTEVGHEKEQDIDDDDEEENLLTKITTEGLPRPIPSPKEDDEWLRQFIKANSRRSSSCAILLY